MGRFSNAELRKFRDTSRCSACVHYCGCQLWLALLLMNDELTAPGLDIILPDITKACPMFFPWTSESARSASTNTGGRSPRRRLATGARCMDGSRCRRSWSAFPALPSSNREGGFP